MKIAFLRLVEQKWAYTVTTRSHKAGSAVTSPPANQSPVLGITLLWSVYYYMHAGTTNILLGYLFFYCSISIHPSSFTFSVDHSFSTVVSHCNWILFYLSFIFFGCFLTLIVLLNLHYTSYPVYLILLWFV